MKTKKKVFLDDETCISIQMKKSIITPDDETAFSEEEIHVIQLGANYE